MVALVSELIDLTQRLVRIPSHEDETAAGNAVETWLEQHTDATVIRDETGNVIARRNTGAEESLALVGHHDVVPPAESQVVGDPNDPDQYTIEDRDGRLYGRGTADMKGALAACMLAFRDADPNCELVFASFVGEETGGTGAKAAVDAGFAPDYAVVAEGSTNYSSTGVTDVVIAHKGRRASTILATGEATHASIPEEGENAVYRACDAIEVVRNLSVPDVQLFGTQLSGSTVVTEIEGGTAGNVIPEGCSVTVDERTIPGERAELEHVEELPGIELQIDQDHPPMVCDDKAFADTVQAAARESQLGTPQQVTKPHATDAGHLAQAGTACVICGPAESGEAHTDSESVSIEVLERCRRIYQRLPEQM